MWNILVVVIIVIVIWLFNPLLHLKSILPVGVDKKTIQEVNQVQNEAISQVNKARQLQQQEQQSPE